MARSLGDDATLRQCLLMGGSALVDYAEPTERCEWDAELLRLSTDAGDVIGALRAHARLIFDYLELGRPEEADAQIAAHGKIADELGLQRYQWLTFMMRSLRAITDGRFEESDGSARACQAHPAARKVRGDGCCVLHSVVGTRHRARRSLTERAKRSWRPLHISRTPPRWVS